MRSASATRLIETGRPAGSFLTVFNFIDLAAYPDMFVTEVTSGDLADVGGTRIISAREGDAVGDIVTAKSPNGMTLELEVGAVITSDIYTDLLVDWDLLSQLEPQVWDIRVFFDVDEAGAGGIASVVDGTAPLLTKEEFVQSRVEQRRDGANSGNIALFGTVYALAVVAMVQGVAASTLNRRPEYRLLGLLGISRGRIIVTLLAEALVLLATSALLLAAAFAFITWRYLAQAPDVLSTAIAAIPWGTIAVTFVGMSTLFTLTVLTAGLIATRKRDTS